MTTTTTPKPAKPYRGSANVPSIIGLAKRSTAVVYRARDSYRSATNKVYVTVNGRGTLRPDDYGKPADVHVRCSATEVSFSLRTDNGHKDDAMLNKAKAVFEAELTAAGWDVIKRDYGGWTIVGPGWREYMRKAHDETIAEKIRTEDRNARAVREAEEISRLLASRGVTGKYVENYGSARVTLYLADIEKLLGGPSPTSPSLDRS